MVREWEKLKVADVCRTMSGGTPSRQKPEYYEKGSIPWVKTGELNKKYITDTDEKLTKIAIQKSSAKIIPENTVLMAMYGATIGKTSILKVEAATNQACCAFIPNPDKLNAEFLYYSLIEMKEDIIKLGSGAAQPNISQQIIKEIQILIPPIDEQQKITEILSSIDEAIEKTEAIIKQTETVKKGLMQQLLTKGIGHTEFKETEIGKIPTSWVTMQIQDCSEILDSKRVPLSKKVREGKKGPYPYYGATGIVDTINEYIFDHDIVLIGEDGDHFKKYKDWSMTNLVRGKSWVNNHAHVLNAKEHLTINEWIFRYFEHRDLSPYLSIQGATRLKLTQQNLKQMLIALPPIEEQKRICAIINSVVAKLESEKKALVKYQSLKKGLMHVLLTGEIRVNTKQLDEVLV